jgi:phenylalanyl-tRNA synthetase alpha chain
MDAPASAEEMVRTLDDALERGLQVFDRATSLEELEAARVQVFGRKASLSQVQRAIGSLPAEARSDIGQRVNETRARLQEAADTRYAGLERGSEEALLVADRVDLSLPGRRLRPGSLHPLSHAEDEIVDIFLRLGYRVAEGPEVEDEWHNFEALNIPPDHPARTMKDSIYVSVPGRPDLLLRTETSSVQIRTMQSQPPPVYIIAPGRVYRRETPDATHLPVFHQVEGLVVDEGITFADLKGTLDVVAKALFGSDRETKLGPAFFPFVEPGAELAVTCMRCDGVGCPVCGNGWIELLGCGMVHPQVLVNCGYDPERYTGFAFGLGIDRVALLKYRIPDIRLLVDGDIRFLAQFGASR